MRFDINDYKGKYVMRCKTKEEAKEFCDYIDCYGIYYNPDTSFNYHNGNICYNFNVNTFDSKDFYEKYGYTILEWSDFKENKFAKAYLKDGMVVEFNNGERRLVLGDRLIGFDKGNDLVWYLVDLTWGGGDSHSIHKVYKSIAYNFNNIFKDDYLTLIWERKEEPVEMTLEEICAALGKEIKIVKG